MSTYKITNITNLAGKRDNRYNSTLEVEYVDEMMKKTVKIKPASTLYLSIPSLPLSVHRLRVKGLVSVVEVSGEEQQKLSATKTKDDEKKKEVKKSPPKKTYSITKSSTKKSTPKKTTTKKSGTKKEEIEKTSDNLTTDSFDVKE